MIHNADALFLLDSAGLSFLFIRVRYRVMVSVKSRLISCPRSPKATSRFSDSLGGPTELSP